MSLEKYALNKNYIKLLYESFFDLHNFLVDFNVSYWASGGSILGAVRHQGQNPIDDDIDLEISYLDVPVILSTGFKNVLRTKGYVVKLHSETGKKRKDGYVYDWIKINSKKKVNGRISSIDIFPTFLDVDGQGKLRTYFSSPYVNELWPKGFHYYKDLLPLKQAKFANGVINIPKNPKPYLKRLYGKDWNRVMYITMDRDHIPLEKPIKINTTKFTAAKSFAKNGDRQKILDPKHILLTMAGTNLFLKNVN